MVQVQQKVLGIIPSTTGANQQTFTSFQPRTATVTIRPNTTGTVGTTTTSQVMSFCFLQGLLYEYIASYESISANKIIFYIFLI